MKYVAAYALLALSGNTEISVDDVTNFLKDVGAEPEQSTVELVVNALKGKPIHEAINEGLAKVSTLNVGAGGAGGAGGDAGAGDAEEKVEEEPEEEEADVSMPDLFGGDSSSDEEDSD